MKRNLKKGQKKARIFDEFMQVDGETGNTKKKFKDIQMEKLKTSRNKKWIKLRRAVMKDGSGRFKKVKF
jgi:hypothetical protein